MWFFGRTILGMTVYYCGLIRKLLIPLNVISCVVDHMCGTLLHIGNIN